MCPQQSKQLVSSNNNNNSNNKNENIIYKSALVSALMYVPFSLQNFLSNTSFKFKPEKDDISTLLTTFLLCRQHFFSVDNISILSTTFWLRCNGKFFHLTELLLLFWHLVHSCSFWHRQKCFAFFFSQQVICRWMHAPFHAPLDARLPNLTHFYCYSYSKNKNIQVIIK